MKKREGKKVFKKITAENFLNLEKKIGICVQEVEKTPFKVSKNGSTS